MAATEELRQRSHRRYSIGYALAHKKQQSFIRDSLVNLAADRSIDLIKINADLPLIQQGPPFDCILHKLYGEDWKQQLLDYKTRRNPNVVILDAPEAIERLHNRQSMLEVVSELEIACYDANYSFGIPEQIVIDDVQMLNDEKTLQGLRFPMIAKPLVADGSAKSHKMSLVYNHQGLSNLKPPIVLQEFVNHGGVIFKVYVVGEYVKCVKRKSLPDVSGEMLESFGGLKTFSLVSNLSKNEMNDEIYCKLMRLDDCEMPPNEFITEIANGLRKALKLNLFNFDVIRDNRIGNRYLVIDINYFPGYAKMPAYESVMTEFFWNVVAKNERRGEVECEENERKDEDCDKRKLVDNIGLEVEGCVSCNR